MVKANADMEEIPGVVVGGGVDKYPVPATQPAPSTSVEPNIFLKIAEKLEQKLNIEK